MARRVGAVLFLMVLSTALAMGQEDRNHLYIRDTGMAQFKAIAASDWNTVISSRFITSDNDVRTLKASKAHLQFFVTSHDVARVVLLENVQLTVRQLELASNVRTVTLSQRNGRIWVDATVSKGVQQRFTVETPSATIAVRGTRFYNQVADDGTTRTGCADGRVEVTAQGKTVVLHTGDYTIVRPGAPPDAPQWDTTEFGPKPRQLGPSFNIDLGTIFTPPHGENASSPTQGPSSTQGTASPPPGTYSQPSSPNGAQNAHPNIPTSVPGR